MIHIYTDGGCSGNPGPGGWAYVIIRDWGCGIAASGTGDWADGDLEQEPVILAEKWGAERATTNNRMELQAVIEALEALSAGVFPTEVRHEVRPIEVSREKVNVYTDSQYVQKGISIWINDWKRKGWKTSDKKPVKNQDLWQHLDALTAGFDLGWVWVKGHIGNKYNEMCDSMTRKAIVSLQN